MDAATYIKSGILEEYCLGLLDDADQALLIQMTLLYPEVKAELTAIELAMETYAAALAVQPPPGVKAKILNTLGFTGPGRQPGKFPAIDKNTNHLLWLRSLDHLIPAIPPEDFTCTIINKDNRFQQMLVVTKTDVNEEDHDDYLESFFILKGQCACTVGSDLFKLGPGDFLEIPLHVKHNIKVLSPWVVAILQYQFV